MFCEISKPIYNINFVMDVSGVGDVDTCTVVNGLTFKPQIPVVYTYVECVDGSSKNLKYIARRLACINYHWQVYTE